MQQVLQSGNTSNISIVLTANITAVTATADTVVSNTSLNVNGVLRDGTAAAGGSNQILSSTGSGVRWVDIPVYNVVSPLLYDTPTKTFSIQVANSSQSGYLSSADWINFDGKQDAIILTTTGTSGPATFAANTLNIPVYTPDLSGYVPTSRTLTINGVTYDLSANRSWTIPAGVASVTATSPLFSSGGADPDISIQVANATQDGYLSAADWNTFNSKQSTLTFSSPLVNTAGVVSIPAATTSVSGYLTNTDWNTFNAKQGALTLTTTGTSGASTLVGDTLNIPQYQSVLTNPVTGTGVAGQVAFWDGTNNITSDTGLVYDNTNNVLTLNTNATGSATAFVINNGLGSGIFTITGTGIFANSLNAGFGNTSVNILTSTSAVIVGFSSFIRFGGSGGSGRSIITSPADASGRFLLTNNASNNFNILHFGAQTSSFPALKRNAAGLQVILGDDTGLSSLQTSSLLINTTTDAGFRLDVNGTGRFSGQLTANSFVPTSSTIPTNGMYLSGTNTLGFATNGTLDMVINEVGSVGIGSTSLTGLTLRASKVITGQFISSGGSFGVGILSDGQIQSDEVGGAAYYRATITTQAAAFTSANVVGYWVEQGTLGASSAITNQNGFLVGATLIGATNNFGFRGQIPSGTNRWNIYMDGTANNYMAGSLGIGGTSLTGFNLLIQKDITGATSSFGIHQTCVVRSAVTSAAYVNSTNIQVENVAFTLPILVHYRAAQNTFGASATVTNQYGFSAESTLTGATNNYGFFGGIAAGTGRWNLYMNGTASNYLNGSLGVGATSINASAKVQIDSTTQGFLPPRMTAAQRTAIASPATGLIVYQTDGVEGLWLRVSTGWVELTVV